MVSEAPEIAGFCEDREREDGADARGRLQALVIRKRPKQLIRPMFECGALGRTVAVRLQPQP
jgi:hypothetical protein